MRVTLRRFIASSGAEHTLDLVGEDVRLEPRVLGDATTVLMVDGKVFATFSPRVEPHWVDRNGCWWSGVKFTP